MPQGTSPFDFSSNLQTSSIAQPLGAPYRSHIICSLDGVVVEVRHAVFWTTTHRDDPLYVESR